MGNVISRQVKVSNTPDKPLYVDIVQAGDSLNIYDDAPSLAGAATATIIDYTVPVMKEFVLRRIEFSGTNRGVYSIEINSTLEAKKRTYYTKFDDEFVFEDLVLAAGDNIELIVENKGTMSADFNANMQGNLRDA